MRTCRKKSESLVLLVLGVVLGLNSTYPIRSVLAQEPAGQEEGGGRVIRQQKEEFGEITPKEKAEQMKQVGEEVGETGVVTPKASEAEGAGRVTRQQQVPTPAESPKGSITPYGRVELDAIYSNRNMNPLDPGQFNGYATAAGQSSNSSSTLNPRYSVLGIRAARTDDVHTLKGVVEIDFYGQTTTPEPPATSSSGKRLIRLQTYESDRRPRLDAGHGAAPGPHRLLNHGVRWKSVAAPSTRSPFAIVSRTILKGLLTAFRFERGLSAINPYTQRQPFTGHGAGAFSGTCSGQPSNFTCSENAFNDPVKMPYAGARLAYGRNGIIARVFDSCQCGLPVLPFCSGFTGCNISDRRSAPSVRQRHQFVCRRRGAGCSDYEEGEVLRRDRLWPGARCGVLSLCAKPEPDHRAAGSHHGWPARSSATPIHQTLRSSPAMVSTILSIRIWQALPQEASRRTNNI